MANPRGERDPMEEDEGDDEVANDDDVFQIAALVEGQEEEEEAAAMNYIASALRGRASSLLPLSAINSLVEPRLKVHDSAVKKEDESSSSESSSSFELSEAGAADDGDEEEGGKAKKAEPETSKGSVNSFIDREIQYTPGPVTAISYSENAKIEYIGDVLHAMGTPEQRSLVIKHRGSSYGLDIDSILCLADKSCLGVVNETFGPITQPFYRVYISKPPETAPIPPIASADVPLQTESLPSSDSVPKTESSETPAAPTSEPALAEETSPIPDSNPISFPNPEPIVEVPVKPKFPPLAKVEDVPVGTRVYFVVDEKQYLIPKQLLLASQKAPAEEEEDSEEVYFSDDEKEKEYNAAKRKRKESEGDEGRPTKKPRRDNEGNPSRGGGGRGGNRGRGRGGNNNNNNNNYNNNRQFDQGRGNGQGQPFYPMMAPGYTQYHYPQYSNQYDQGPRQGGYGYNPQLPFQAMQPPPYPSQSNPYYQQQPYPQQQQYQQQGPQQGYASGGYQFAANPQGGAPPSNGSFQ